MHPSCWINQSTEPMPCSKRFLWHEQEVAVKILKIKTLQLQFRVYAIYPGIHVRAQLLWLSNSWFYGTHLNVGRLASFCCDDDGDGAEKERCFFPTCKLDPPAVKISDRTAQLFFTKWSWRKAFAWLTNFMNKHGNCVYCRKESRDPVLKYGSSCEVRRRQRNIRAIQSVPGNAKTL